MSDREYSTTDAAHGLSGFSSNSKWAEVQEGGLWSHYPTVKGPKESGDGKSFVDPVQAGPQRAELWKGANEPAASDNTREWPVDYREKGGVPTNDSTSAGKADGVYSAGRHDGTERGNSPWFRGAKSNGSQA